MTTSPQPAPTAPIKLRRGNRQRTQGSWYIRSFTGKATITMAMPPLMPMFSARPVLLAANPQPITLRQGNRRRFSKWIKAFGVSTLARELNTNRNTIYVWMRGDRGRYIAPSTGFMSRIVQLSTARPFEYGPITFNDMLDGTDGFRGMHGTGYRTPRINEAQKAGA